MDDKSIAPLFGPPVLSRLSPEPLYRQLAQRLERAVASGSLKPGERLEPEWLLARNFRVSRITVRQAVEELVRKHILVRKQGKGTFVTASAVRHDLKRLHGLLGSLFAQAKDASARLLRYELAVPPPDTLGSAPTDRMPQALALERLYLIGGRPAALAQAWLVPEVAMLPRAQAELISTEDMMRAVGIRIAASEVAIRATPAGRQLGRLLAVPARAPVLVLHRRAIGDDGAVKEVAWISLCSDAYELVCPTRSARAETLFDIRNVEPA